MFVAVVCLLGCYGYVKYKNTVDSLARFAVTYLKAKCSNKKKPKTRKKMRKPST